MTVEQFLARLYTSEALRARFSNDPFATAIAEGFDAEQARELAKIDLESLRLAAGGFAMKRELKRKLRRL